MKSLFTFPCLLILLLGCQQQKQISIEPDFKPEAKAFIQLTAQNLPDTFDIYLKVYKILPEGIEKPEKVRIWGNKSVYLQFPLDRPTKTVLAVGDSLLTCFAAPNDTTILSISVNMQQEQVFLFRGATAPLNRYYQEKSKKLGYRNLNLQFEKLMYEPMDMRKLRHEINKISKREKRFLESYSSKNSLPAWFLDYEQAETDYLTAGYLLLVPQYYQTSTIPLRSVPDSYYRFLQEIKVQSPEALLSGKYFFFLDQYFAIGEDRSGYENLDGYERILQIHRQRIGKANEHLDGRVKEIYLAHLLSGLLPHLPAGYPLDSLLHTYQLENSALLNFRNLLAPDTTTPGATLAADSRAPNF